MPAHCLHSRRKLGSEVAEEAAVAQAQLLKLRAVLMLLATKHGAKVNAAHSLVEALKENGIRVSVRALYYWRTRYLRFGFAGIDRRRRSDAGRMRAAGREVFSSLVNAAARIEKHGDLSREYRRLSLPVGFGTFRFWIRRIQRQIVFMPRRGNGLFL